MRELHGVFCNGEHISQALLKHHAILVDKFRIIDDAIVTEALVRSAVEEVKNDLHITNVDVGSAPQVPWSSDFREVQATLDYLESRGLVQREDHAEQLGSLQKVVFERLRSAYMELPKLIARDRPERKHHEISVEFNVEDFMVRSVTNTAQGDGIDFVAFLRNSMAPKLLTADATCATETTLRIAMEALPVPDDNCSWEDIINFKEDLQDKKWGFRRFLKTLATKRQTESEVREEVEWMVNEYSKAMKIHHLKESRGFVEVYVLPVIEIVENLVKFNWSKIVKGALSVQKRKIELLEAEMKAPGRECAYVFDARKRFGGV